MANLALGKSYTYGVLPSSTYPDNGNDLTNGIILADGVGVTDTDWVGWQNTNPVITLDLGQVRSLQSVALHAGSRTSSSIYFPTAVKVELSSDGSSFTLLGTTSFSLTNSSSSVTVRPLLVEIGGQSARYIRLTITRGAGQWTFLSEVTVEPTPVTVDLAGQMIIPPDADLPCLVAVTPNGLADVNYTVTPVYREEFPAAMETKEINQISASMNVAPNGLGDVWYQAVPVPVTAADLTPVADAFVRESRPTLNYGQAAQLAVGSESGGRFRSLLRWDLSGLPQGIVVKMAALVLHAADGAAMDIGASLADGAWTENGVTWLNQPGAGASLGTLAIPAGSGTVTLDLTDAVNGWLQGQPNNGILLKAVDETLPARLLYGAEYTDVGMRPTLHVEYVSATVPSYDRSSFPASATIRPTATSALPAAVEVHTTWGFSSVRASGWVRTEKEAIAEAVISRPVQPAAASVRRWADESVGASGTVRDSATSDMQLSVAVSRHDVAATVAIRHKSELPGNVTARRTEAAFLAAEGTLSQPWLAASATTHLTADLPGSVTVPYRVTGDLPGSVSARQTAWRNIHGTIGVVRGPNDMPGSMHVNGRYFPASMTVTGRNAIAANAWVRLTEVSEIPASASGGGLSCTLEVRVPAEAEFEATAAVRVTDEIDGPMGVVSVRQSWQEDVTAAVVVSQPALLAALVVSRPDVQAALSVRQTASGDLEAVLEVNKKQMAAWIGVTRREIVASATVQQTGRASLACAMTLSAWADYTDELYYSLPQCFREEEAKT